MIFDDRIHPKTSPSVFLKVPGDYHIGIIRLYRGGRGNTIRYHTFHQGAFHVSDFTIYFGEGHNNGLPICVDLISGDVKWGGKIRGPGNGSAAITAVDGHLIFRYQSGEVALIEATPKEYKLKGSFKPVFQERESWAHPVAASGKLYLREQNTLMCYDLTAN